MFLGVPILKHIAVFKSCQDDERMIKAVCSTTPFTVGKISASSEAQTWAAARSVG